MKPARERNRKLLPAWRPPKAWALTPSLIVVLLGAVLASGLIMRWADDPRGDIRLRGEIGETLQFTPSQTAEVSSVRLGTILHEQSDIIATPGVFVAMQLRLTTRGEEVERALRCVLHVDGRDIISTTDSNLSLGFPPPGFSNVRDVIFEVPADPEHLVGARLRCRPYDLLDATTNEIDVDLGFTNDNVTQRIDEAAAIVRVAEVDRPHR